MQESFSYLYKVTYLYLTDTTWSHIKLMQSPTFHFWRCKSEFVLGRVIEGKKISLGSFLEGWYLMVVLCDSDFTLSALAKVEIMRRLTDLLFPQAASALLWSFIWLVACQILLETQMNMLMVPPLPLSAPIFGTPVHLVEVPKQVQFGDLIKKGKLVIQVSGGKVTFKNQSSCANQSEQNPKT